VKTQAPTSWEQVYRAEGPRLWRSLLLLTGNPEIASDAMAEAFAQGIARGAAVRKPGAWVWRASFMIARGELKSQRESLERPEPMTHGSEHEELLDVLRLLSGLPPMQRGATVLHYYAGYSLAETASILGSSRSAVGVHLFRARTRLRKELGGDDEA
jgi:RNA polymerase sigma-70 factor, ECF subfamily